jgi:cytochrome b6-f complex iron-sulfur subunit
MSPTSPADERTSVAQWPSPWPYDFPVEGDAKTPKDKAARVAGISEVQAPVRITRREAFFATLAGWGAFATAGGIGSLALVRFLFPNVSFEPAQVFKTDLPSKFAPNTVDETWKPLGVWMVNTGGRIIAVSTVCTHLGCTPNWLTGEQKFKCPCHGSGYYMNGVNFEGPTPRPLERFRVSVDAVDGRVVVDKTSKCQFEQGTCDAPGFYLSA